MRLTRQAIQASSRSRRARARVVAGHELAAAIEHRGRRRARGRDRASRALGLGELAADAAHPSEKLDRARICLRRKRVLPRCFGDRGLLAP
jgi:hypothetical protein